MTTVSGAAALHEPETRDERQATGPPPEPPLDALRRLRAQGRLAADFPAVGPLLNELAAAGTGGWTELARAGRLLDGVDRDAVLAAAPETATAVVALTGHSTVDPVRPSLTGEFARHGILLETRSGDFDAYLRDLQDPASHLHAEDVDLALCVLDAHTLLDETPSPWQADDLDAAVRAKLDQLRQLAEEFTGRSTATLVLNTVPLPRTVTHALVDLESRAKAGIAWREFNSGLLRLALDVPGVQVVDLDPLAAAGGPTTDPRMAAYAKQHLGDGLLARYAREVAHLARTLRGRAKKVLVVDADNTLWDGVLGDDGADGVAAATTFRGEAFGNFQRLVRQIGSQGVLLAVSSKNDHDPLVEVLRTHPDMTLREADFARVNANWHPKDANLRDIARRLNLGVDSLVFADDSAFECGLVADGLPQVAVVRLDDEPALHIEKLLADGWFDSLRLTAEDRARNALYRAEGERAELLESAASPQEYLDRLAVRVRVGPAGSGDVARLAQLSLRTNQFNLTTERLAESEVAARAADPEHLVATIRSGDRFGENGLVGAVFARYAEDGLHIDNMLLSCRVFARGIEQAAVAAVLAHARDRGVPTVRASYRATAKNGRVRDFWPSVGFAAAASPDDDTLHFRRDPEEGPAVPPHIDLENALEGTRP